MRYADDELRENKDFVLEAITINPRGYEYISPELKKDKDILKKAVEVQAGKKPPHENWEGSWSTVILADASEELKRDRGFIKEICAIDYRQAYGMADELKDDKEFILELIDIHPATFRAASEKIRSDRELARKVIANDPFAYFSLPEDLRKEDDFVLQAISVDPFILNFIIQDPRGPDRTRAEDSEFMVKAIQTNMKSIKQLQHLLELGLSRDKHYAIKKALEIAKK